MVFVDMPIEQMKISTLRHNRARGSEDVELTAEVLRDLQRLGALDWAQDSLMMDDVEINRLLEDVKAPEELAGEEFSEAWIPQKGGDTETGSTETVKIGEGHEAAATSQAIKDRREHERKLKEAKNEEERQMIQKDRSVYRLALIFSGEEAKIVKAVLGKTPAETLVKICRERLKS